MMRWYPREMTSHAEIYLPKRNADATASLRVFCISNDTIARNAQRRPTCNNKSQTSTITPKVLAHPSTANTKPDLRTSPQTRNTGALDCLPTTHLLPVRAVHKQTGKASYDSRGAQVACRQERKTQRFRNSHHWPRVFVEAGTALKRAPR